MLVGKMIQTLHKVDQKLLYFHLLLLAQNELLIDPFTKSLFLNYIICWNAAYLLRIESNISVVFWKILSFGVFLIYIMILCRGHDFFGKAYSWLFSFSLFAINLLSPVKIVNFLNQIDQRLEWHFLRIYVKLDLGMQIL